MSLWRYTLHMPKDIPHSTEDDPGVRLHLANVADNLQFVADLGYGDVALAVPRDGVLRVTADARPMTAIAAIAATRVGRSLRHDDEPEAYAALATGRVVTGERRRTTRGISYSTVAYPVGPPESPYGVVLRDLAQQVVEAPGTMEQVFMKAAEDLLGLLGQAPLFDIDSDEPFSTVRRAGDGVLCVDESAIVSYASPNAVNIMRLAGVEGLVTGRPVTELPGADRAVAPLLGVVGARAVEVAFGERVLGYRSIGLGTGVIVFAEDVTDARRREQEIKVKEATIREVHHRVKNNLQTVASLLRIQGRRTESDEARRALAEAMERVSSMAVVHELLAGSTEERIDFMAAAHTVVEMVHRGLAGDNPGISVEVTGETGQVPAQMATSLALVVAELVHNAIEHGLAGRDRGKVQVKLRRLGDEMVLTVRDTGAGLPDGFSLESTPNLGLAIVRTLVEDDLRGSIVLGSGRGTTVTVRFPLIPDDREV